MTRGVVYLFAVMDWSSRRALSWRLSNTLTTDFCMEAVEEAITRYGAPEIFNTDQGSQFTRRELTGLLKDHSNQISMDGKGCWRDNVFVERLWRSIKYERMLAGQRLRGTALEEHQIRRSVSACLRQRQRGQAKLREVCHVLQPAETAPGLDHKTPEEYYFDNLPALPNTA
jgi:putative transposase